jgi:ApaG protein
MGIGDLFAYEATTDGITVRAQPRFAEDQSDASHGHWVWYYHIRIENDSGAPVQLVDRYWIITDGEGKRRDVMGEGVVGEQPLIAHGASFDYVSGCPLTTPMGNMRGSYGMIDSGGRRLEVAIPSFDLISPDSKRAAN